MDMIDKVAAAIWSAHTGATDFNEDTHRHDEKEREWWRMVARESLKAMREPTEEMIAGGHLLDPLGCDIEQHDAQMVYTRIWHGMIDVALNSPS